MAKVKPDTMAKVKPEISSKSRPTPTSTPRTPAKEQQRNRESQRQSRERRKEYVASLEARLRAYEADGTQASAAMQDAARQVVAENHGLRALLYRLGYGDQVINEFLRQGSGEEGRVRGMVGETLVGMAEGVVRGGEKGRGRVVKAETGRETVRRERGVAEGCGSSGCAGTSTSRDTMDCEEAARLIASFRGTHSADQIWPELGCSAVKRTAVKNSLVMSLADGGDS